MAKIHHLFIGNSPTVHPGGAMSDAEKRPPAEQGREILGAVQAHATGVTPLEEPNKYFAENGVVAHYGVTPQHLEEGVVKLLPVPRIASQLGRYAQRFARAKAAREARQKQLHEIPLRIAEWALDRYSTYVDRSR